MARLIVKNWRDFQHYKDRNPTWIKLHKKLLDDYVFHRLPLASRALAPMLWLLSSESNDGSIDYDIEMIAFRLRCSKSDVVSGLNPLIEQHFLQVEQDASDVLAHGYHEASLYKEEKRREEREADAEHKSKKTLLPEKFELTADMQKYALENGVSNPTNELEKFKACHTAKASRFANWNSAWQYWVRNSRNFNRGAPQANGEYQAPKKLNPAVYQDQ